jgi:hypothetical protein
MTYKTVEKPIRNDIWPVSNHYVSTNIKRGSRSCKIIEVNFEEEKELAERYQVLG